MKILITGATGFIGRRLVEILSETSHQIICLLRLQSDASCFENYLNIQIIRSDFKDMEKMKDIFHHIDVVIHLAGQMGGPGVTYEQFYEVNCNLTVKLLDASAEAGVKHFIYCSTPGVLGFGKRLAKETDSYAPRNGYEKTKVIAEKKVRRICREAKMPYTIIRPDFVYGPGDTRRVRMYRLIRKRKFILTTSGKSFLHPTYIDDVVHGFLCCIENENAHNQTFNIAAETDVTSGEYLKTIAKHTGVKLIHINIGIVLSRLFAGIVDALSKILLHKEGFVSRNKIDFLAMDHSSDIEKAQKYLGYRPQYDCDKGLEITMNWCKENALL
ncbi:MAG: NAD(P)-dependent oxidoreductase [Lachnospiraceae bacterium]|nr:NAD(P)-dependent oxidoreductase [Lachnospiraceae bacterium]